MESFSTENILYLGSVLLVFGVLIGKMSYRFGVPLLLVFLLVGMGFGVDGLGICFDDMKTAQFIGTIALCIILFSGGLDTKYKAISPVAIPGLALSTMGVLLTALLTGTFVWWLSGMSWTNIHFAFLPSLLLAATMSSTDSASVFGILGSQKVQLKQNLRPMLELESGSNDPMAYMLTILLIETITLGGDLRISTLMCQLVLQFVVGGAVGYGLGKGSVWLVKKYVNMNTNGKSVDEAQSSSMLTIMLIGCAFYTFVLTDWLKGNGYLAVYICGIVLGNSQIPYRRGICRFVGSMSWLGQIVVFLMLGLLVNPHEMVDVAAVSILIGAFMILAGRPLSVMICLLPFRRISVKAKAFVSWVGLRGAVPIIFATYHVIAGVEGSSQLFNIVFFVTLLSLLVQGTTVISFAKKLKIAEEPSVEESDFGVELSEELSTSLHTMIVTKEHLETAETLRDMNLPKGQLVMMIRRNNQHIIPNGRLKLKAGDALLIIEENEPVMPQE